jgi:putative acetyltransferase
MQYRPKMAHIAVRPYRPDDHDGVQRVVSAAFHPGDEATLVEQIRTSEYYVADMELVAVVGGEVVGHVMVSGASLVDDAGAVSPIVMLSPLAVDPAHQGHGIGGALVKAVSAIADRRSEPVIVLEGSPSYYSQFGFEPSINVGITLPLPDWAPPEAAQVLRLSEYDRHRARLRGTVRYPPAFDSFD